jgi:hypothetical protein
MNNLLRGPYTKMQIAHDSRQSFSHLPLTYRNHAKKLGRAPYHVVDGPCGRESVSEYDKGSWSARFSLIEHASVHIQTINPNTELGSKLDIVQVLSIVRIELNQVTRWLRWQLGDMTTTACMCVFSGDVLPSASMRSRTVPHKAVVPATLSDQSVMECRGYVRFHEMRSLQNRSHQSVL